MNLRRRTAALILVIALLFSLVPRSARAEGALFYEQIISMEDLVSGQYALVSPEGFGAGCLQDGQLVPVPLNMDQAMPLWTVDMSDWGILLTDPAGTSIAPAQSGDGTLTAREYRWNAVCSGGVFTFSPSEGDTALSFTLYRMTERDEPSAQPPELDPEKWIPVEQEEPPEEPGTDPEQTPPAGPGLFFGQLHSHTADSDGYGTPAEAYTYAATVAGLDFLAVTDHSNSFDGAKEGVLSQDASSVSEKWRLGREAALAATTGNFLALYGFEMTWHNGLGHISTFFTPGFQSSKQSDFTNYATALERYYQTLATVPGSVSQFNHYSTFYGEFENFAHHSVEADAAMALLEVVSEGAKSYDAYTMALDAGWHVAPTNNQNNHNGAWGTADSGRTVVYAEALTEEAFAAALRARRVYATEDTDLEILYKLDGYLFGSMLTNRRVGETVNLTASLSDFSDGTVGTVEVIVDGGKVAASKDVSAAFGDISFTLPSTYRYYYLRITQPDGDIAVTAPVWIEQRETMQITSFTTDTQLAIRDRPFTLRVEVENRDRAQLNVEQVTFSIGGKTVASVSEPAPVPGNSTGIYTMELSCREAGASTIQVEVTGTLEGDPVSSRAQLTMTFLTEDLVTTIVADGSHGALPALAKLEAIAAGNRMVLLKTEELTPEILSGCDILLLPAPEQNYNIDYVNLILEYIRSGRTLILCGQGDRTAPEAASRLNALLEALGLTARFRDDLAYDPENNGGRVDELYTTVYNGSINLTQPYCQIGGCTLSPGDGTWLVKGMSTTFSIDADGDGVGVSGETYTESGPFGPVQTLVTSPGEAVLLVREETVFGGSVYMSGGMFLADDMLDPGGSNSWDFPNGNAQLLETILSIPAAQPLEVISLEQARSAPEGETVRVRGYVTAGTAIPHNSFPNRIYLQDDTAGLGILDVTAPGIRVGTPLEAYLLRKADGFHLLHMEVLDSASLNVQPKKPGNAQAVNMDLYADQLIQAEGEVVCVTVTEDGLGVSVFTLEDKDGNRVTVSIEPQIASASTGENTLADIVQEGNWVSAIGILSRSGGQTVLLVRSCDEVVLIREKNIVYRVVDGEYSVWIRKDGKSLFMEVEGPGEEFLGIEVDGVMIDQGHYQTTEEENLLFRFWPRYLKTLELGSHSVVFKFRDGEAKATLVVWNHADNPYTGDPILLPLSLMLFSGGILLKKRREWLSARKQTHLSD